MTRSWEQLPSLFGETTAVLTEARQLTDNESFLTALDSLEVLTSRLADNLPETTLDLAQLPAVPYYTGIMFKVFGDKVPMLLYQVAATINYLNVLGLPS